MRLTIIGNNGAVPRPGGTCSGYLVEDLGARILIDCGTGVYSRLQKHLHPFDLDAVVISHLHADHFFDLVPFRYALTYALTGRRASPLPLLAPQGTGELLGNFARSFGAPPDFFSGVFELREYRPGTPVSLGRLEAEFAPMRHFVPSFGIVLRGSASLAYSADTAWCDEVVAIARGADVFLCEATAQEHTYAQTKAGHLSAVDAARVAAEAGVPFLLLTHIWHELDPATSLVEARPHFSGRLELAEESQTYLITRG